jgi:Ca2+-transporting ATPase
MLFAITTGLARPLSPGQLLWINLLSDVLPAMGLALERPDSMLMSEALPASPAILLGADIPQLVRDGGLIAGSAAAAQAAADLVRGASGSAVGFTSLVTGQLLYALACRPAGRPVSGYLSGALIASFAAQAAALYLPSLRGLVGHSMAPADLCLSAVGGLLPSLRSRPSMPTGRAMTASFTPPNPAHRTRSRVSVGPVGQCAASASQAMIRASRHVADSGGRGHRDLPPTSGPECGLDA